MGFMNVYTHKISALTEIDFTLAALIDALPVTYSPKWLVEHPEALVETVQPVEKLQDAKIDEDVQRLTSMESMESLDMGKVPTVARKKTT